MGKCITLYHKLQKVQIIKIPSIVVKDKRAICGELFTICLVKKLLLKRILLTAFLNNAHAVYENLEFDFKKVQTTSEKWETQAVDKTTSTKIAIFYGNYLSQKKIQFEHVCTNESQKSEILQKCLEQLRLIATRKVENEFFSAGVQNQFLVKSLMTYLKECNTSLREQNLSQLNKQNNSATKTTADQVSTQNPDELELELASASANMVKTSEYFVQHLLQHEEQKVCLFKRVFSGHSSVNKNEITIYVNFERARGDFCDFDELQCHLFFHNREVACVVEVLDHVSIEDKAILMYKLKQYSHTLISELPIGSNLGFVQLLKNIKFDDLILQKAINDYIKIASKKFFAQVRQKAHEQEQEHSTREVLTKEAVDAQVVVQKNQKYENYMQRSEALRQIFKKLNIIKHKIAQGKFAPELAPSLLAETGKMAWPSKNGSVNEVSRLRRSHSLLDVFENTHSKSIFGTSAPMVLSGNLESATVANKLQERENAESEIET